MTGPTAEQARERVAAYVAAVRNWRGYGDDLDGDECITVALGEPLMLADLDALLAAASERWLPNWCTSRACGSCGGCRAALPVEPAADARLAAVARYGHTSPCPLIFADNWAMTGRPLRHCACAALSGAAPAPTDDRPWDWAARFRPTPTDDRTRTDG